MSKAVVFSVRKARCVHCFETRENKAQ